MVRAELSLELYGFSGLPGTRAVGVGLNHRSATRRRDIEFEADFYVVERRLALICSLSDLIPALPGEWRVFTEFAFGYESQAYGALSFRVETTVNIQHADLDASRRRQLKRVDLGIRFAWIDLQRYGLSHDCLEAEE
jgi:hypothetical protein